MNHLLAKIVVIVTGGIFLLAGCTPGARFVRRNNVFADDPRPVNQWLPRLGLMVMGAVLLYAGFFRLP